MVYAPHRRLSMVGTLGSETDPQEIFSTSINFTDSRPFAVDGVNLSDIVADTIAFWQRATTNIAPYARLRTIKVADIGADGKYVADPYVQAVNVPGGGVTSTVLPYQVALCVSLLSDRRGPSGKGRFYLPAPSINLNEDGTFLASKCADVQASAATFLSDINNEPGIDDPGPRVVIASTKGFNTNVSGVRVGRVPDTIRSRRNKLDESYAVFTPVV